MARRATVVVALVGLVGLLLAATGPAASAAQTKTLHFTSPEKQEVFHFVDVGKKGDSLGDYVVITGPLHGATAGHFYAVCTLVHLKPTKAQCPATMTFSNGKITFQGVINPRSNKMTFGITGGTGPYNTASGAIQLATAKPVDHWTVHLIL